MLRRNNKNAIRLSLHDFQHAAGSRQQTEFPYAENDDGRARTPRRDRTRKEGFGWTDHLYANGFPTRVSAGSIEEAHEYITGTYGPEYAIEKQRENKISIGAGCP